MRKEKIQPIHCNLLYKTRTYLVGNMQYVDDKAGTSWRDKITQELEAMGVIVFNPYQKPFIKDVEEGPQVRLRLEKAMKRGDWGYMEKTMRKIRVFDLNLVDRSDFIIAYINPNVGTWGSAEEIVTAVRMKKPIFLAVKGGKSKCPYWIFGMFPHKYIYNDVDEIVAMLKSINYGRKELDNERWKLLRKEYR